MNSQENPAVGYRSRVRKNDRQHGSRRSGVIGPGCCAYRPGCGCIFDPLSGRKTKVGAGDAYTKVLNYTAPQCPGTYASCRFICSAILTSNRSDSITQRQRRRTISSSLFINDRSSPRLQRPDR